jgi:phospholipid transport system substrate-binding protein
MAGLLSVAPQAQARNADISAPDTPSSATAVSVAQSSQTAQGAFKFVQSTAEAGLKFLSNPQSQQDEKKREFRKLLDSSFDLDTIGRFALGRYWNTATPQQREDYLVQFRRMVVDVYANRFDDYKGQKFEAKTFRAISPTDTLVTSYIKPVDGSADIQVDWRVRSKGNTYKIVDVLVSGVSMSVTQRSDFASVIQRGGGNVDVLINHLKNNGKVSSR